MLTPLYTPPVRPLPQALVLGSAALLDDLRCLLGPAALEVGLRATGGHLTAGPFATFFLLLVELLARFFSEPRLASFQNLA
jgi:hypothetical protein